MIFDNVKSIVIPEGSVKEITCNNVTLWQKIRTIIETVSGVGTIVLQNVIRLVGITQYGKCEQASTPTPSAPVDLKCNNGAIKVSANLLNPTTVPNENKYIYANNGDAGTPYTGTFRHSNYIRIVGGETYHFGMTPYAATSAGLAWYSTSNLGAYISGVSGTNLKNAGMVATAPANANYVRFSFMVNAGYDTDWQNSVYICVNGSMSAFHAFGEVYVDGTDEVLSITAEDEYEGDIVTFDSTSSMNIAELSVDIEPIQDLHGYDNLWPAGGGKNKFDSSLMANAVEAAKFITLDLKPNTEYTMSSDDPCKDGGTYVDLFLCNVGESANSKTNGVKLGESVTRTSDENGQLRVWYRRYKTWITPEELIAFHTQIEEGSTATAWTPYSNECPISGRTGCEISHTGKNIIPSIDDTAFWNTMGFFNRNGTITVRANYKTSTYLPVIGGCQYVFSTFNKNKTTVSGWKGLLVYDSNKQPLQDTLCENNATKVAITIPDEGSYIRMYTILADNIAYQQLELGSTTSDYEGYRGTTYPIPLGQTVYGGTLDVVNGKMHARPYYPSYNGETLVGPWISSMDKYEEGATPTTGAQVVDMGGTVTEISLTPEEITLLEGENNIWSDAGAVDIVVERAAKQTASVENLFAVGDYKDEQDIVSGEVTRKVGVKILDGTEEWTTDTYGGYRRMVLQEVLNASGDTLSVTCSHYVSRSSDARQQPNSIFIASTGKMVIYIDSTQNITTVDEFNAWLAAQYASGTPVVIVYPLAESIEESVTPQSFTVSETATISAESDYINDIALSGTYETPEA